MDQQATIERTLLARGRGLWVCSPARQTPTYASDARFGRRFAASDLTERALRASHRVIRACIPARRHGFRTWAARLQAALTLKSTLGAPVDLPSGSWATKSAKPVGLAYRSGKVTEDQRSRHRIRPGELRPRGRARLGARAVGCRGRAVGCSARRFWIGRGWTFRDKADEAAGCGYVDFEVVFPGSSYSEVT